MKPVRHAFRTLTAAFFFASAGMLIFVLAGTGCSSRRQAARRAGYSRVMTPTPPAFLTGPAILLLTNTASFSARIELQSQNSLGVAAKSGGELLGSGGKFFYAPQTEEAVDVPRQGGTYAFIWDAAENKGYVLSDALQAYAPIASALHVTNLENGVGAAPAQRIAGHPCESISVTTRTAEGSSATFDVLRAMDLNGFPLKIQSSTNAMPFVLTFSKVRLETLSPTIFAPPDGFTRYPTPESMSDELAAREHNLKRRSPPQMEMPMPEPSRF
ncbi:MAG TPA: hypothetical protein VFE51_13000 [Verrucomicrobiae bacterium]|nr:hypothetical protein [Verrucomicrobiae bacterium]